LCALFIVFHHWWWEFVYDLPLYNQSGRFIQHGHVAVNVFIVISGFCLTIPVAKYGVLKGEFAGFIKRRAWRILPPYYFAMLLSLVLIATCIGKHTGTHWDCSIPVTINAFIAHILLLQDLRSGWTYVINHAMWSISVEWRIYFLFPLFVWIWRKNGILSSLFCAAILSLGYYLFLSKFHHGFFNGYACPHYILLFMFGMIGSLITYSRTNQKFKIWKISLFLLSALLIKLAIHFLRGSHLIASQSGILNDIMVGLVATAIMAYMATNNKSIFTRLFSWKPLAFVGTFAYSIYLIHAPLLQCEWLILRALHLTDHTAYIIGCVIGVPIIVALSYVFFWFCERPFIRRRNITTSSLKNA